MLYLDKQDTNPILRIGGILMDIIDVSLYGGKSIFGGRETPLEASIVSCDKYESCSYYQNNQCLNMRSFLSSSCKHGSRSDKKGYTSRARKYHEFQQKWKSHEKYNQLQYPPKKLGVIDNEVVFPYPFIQLKKNEQHQWIITDPGFGSSLTFIPRNEFNVELIQRICSFKPQALMGGTIKSYEEETIPLFLAHLKEVLPELYDQVIEFDSTLVKTLDYVGRKALLSSLKPCVVEYQSRSNKKFNEKWLWDGEHLTYQEGYISQPNIAGIEEILSFTMKPKKDAIISITDNNQVDKDTVFVD